MIDQRFEQLEKEVENYSQKVGRVQGEFSFLKEEIDKLENYKTKYIEDLERSKKAVEVLNMVQKVTRDKIKEGFENLVTHALKYIYSDDYSFQLEFGKRGNLQELHFNIKTPDFEESVNPLDTSGGGVLDIVSLALRAVLIEVSIPKVEGFLILDENFKHLSKEYLENASEFLNELNKKLSRQLILITHQQEFIDKADNLIEVK